MAVVLCDLDGTLCNTEHRDHLANTKNWNAFNAQLIHDTPHLDVVEILKGMHMLGHKIVFVTGRMGDNENQTNLWIQSTLPFLEDYDLFMRPVGDFRPDIVVKQELYEKNIKGQEVLFVLEDRQRVVDMWRKLGFRCHQVQPGAY